MARMTLRSSGVLDLAVVDNGNDHKTLVCGNAFGRQGNMSAAISMRDVAGKIIIITGASSGIGRATAIALARESAQLVMVARGEHRWEALEEEIRTAGGIATSMVLDLRQRDQVETMIRSTHARFGRIDVLINNAGFGFWGTVEKTPAPVVREIFDLNFEAPLLASQLAIPIMKAQGGGHIIDVSIVSPAATRSEFGDHVRHGDVRYRFKPTGPVQSAEDVAAAIVACIKKPKLEVYPSRLSRLLVWGNALVPGVVDKIIIRYFRDRIRTAKQQS